MHELCLTRLRRPRVAGCRSGRCEAEPLITLPAPVEVGARTGSRRVGDGDRRSTPVQEQPLTRIRTAVTRPCCPRWTVQPCGGLGLCGCTGGPCREDRCGEQGNSDHLMAMHT